MTALDSLPADQRAVVELVLARGRDYDEIARLLSIDRAGVRQRALSAFDRLGAQTDVPAPRRALITDYLLGQLPGRVAAEVAARLDHEPAEAAWAQNVADALAPLAAKPLPPIGSPAGGEAAGPEPAAEPFDSAARVERTPGATPVGAGTAVAEPRHTADAAEAADAPGEGGAPAAPRRRPSSRRGGAIVLALGLVALLAIVVIVIAALSGGGSSSSTSSRTAAASAGSTTATTSATPMRLTATAKGSRTQGIAEAFKQSGSEYLAVVAINLPANSTKTGSRNYYAVWLSDGASSNKLLGFAPAVTSNGQLRAATKLDPTEAKYTKILVTLETAAHPTAPGPVVMTGTFTYTVK